MGPIAIRFRRGAQRGLDRPTVGNLVAYGLGLAPVAGGWTAHELAALLFLRARLRAAGVIEPAPVVTHDDDTCPECDPELRA